MLYQHDFLYSFENTRAIVDDHFGDKLLKEPNFRFYLITEPMDQVGITNLRAGQLDVKSFFLEYKPIKNILIKKVDKRDKLLEFLPEYEHYFRIFCNLVLKKNVISGIRLQQPREKVIIQLTKKMLIEKNDPTITLIEGIETAWEVSLFKCAFDLMNIMYEVFE